MADPTVTLRIKAIDEAAPVLRRIRDAWQAYVESVRPRLVLEDRLHAVLIARLRQMRAAR